MAPAATCPELGDITLANDSHTMLQGGFESEGNINIDLSNDTSLTGTLSGKDLQISVSSDGKVDLKGIFEDARLTASSDARIDLSDAVVESAELWLSSDAVVDINARGDIEITADGSQTVNVYGGNIVEKSVDEDTIINIID